jgi:hypothetical protein
MSFTKAVFALDYWTTLFTNDKNNAKVAIDASTAAATQIEPA